MRELEANGVGLDENTRAQETEGLKRRDFRLLAATALKDVIEQYQSENVLPRLEELNGVEEANLGDGLDELAEASSY